MIVEKQTEGRTEKGNDANEPIYCMDRVFVDV